LIASVMLLCLAGCSSAGESGDDDQSADDDSADPSPSFNFGVVDFNYYGDLGGYDGEIYRADQAWAASHVDLAIISQNDQPMQQTWDEIKKNQPRGRWLVWQLAHLFNTNDAAGTCDNPAVGPETATFAQQSADFAAFLGDHPEYGDGEDCFLHARHDGRIGARWHGAGCDVTLEQRGLDGSATDRKDARLFTLVWDQYTWLLNVENDCARDFAAWRAAKQMADGFAGPGYDNLGSPTEDGFYLPTLIDPIDIIEIPDAQETNVDALNGWYFPAVGGLLAKVRDSLSGSPTLVFNGATYCSWDGSTARLAALVGPGIGVWCEDALQYPAWGALGTPDRLAALIDFSRQAHDAGGFVALETFYGGGAENPTGDEVLFYLAAFYLFKNDDDVLAIKPSWNPYQPLQDTCWFGVFARDIGKPTAAATQDANGVFTRAYRGPHGEDVLVVVRADGNEPPVDFDLGGAYQRVLADNSTAEVSGVISLASGDGLILIR
jgi:hypothetical protein